MTKPNMITVSGREELPRHDRLNLLGSERDEMWLNYKLYQGPTDASSHRFGQFIGIVGGFVRAAREHNPETDPVVANLSNEALSRCECELMAWKRGNEAEHKRVCTRYHRLHIEERDQRAVDELQATGCTAFASVTDDGPRWGWWNGETFLSANPWSALRYLKEGA